MFVRLPVMASSSRKPGPRGRSSDEPDDVHIERAHVSWLVVVAVDLRRHEIDGERRKALATVKRPLRLRAENVEDVGVSEAQPEGSCSPIATEK